MPFFGNPSIGMDPEIARFQAIFGRPPLDEMELQAFNAQSLGLGSSPAAPSSFGPTTSGVTASLASAPVLPSQPTQGLGQGENAGARTPSLAEQVVRKRLGSGADGTAEAPPQRQGEEARPPQQSSIGGILGVLGGALDLANTQSAQGLPGPVGQAQPGGVSSVLHQNKQFQLQQETERLNAISNLVGSIFGGIGGLLGGGGG